MACNKIQERAEQHGRDDNANPDSKMLARDFSTSMSGFKDFRLCRRITNQRQAS